MRVAKPHRTTEDVVPLYIGSLSDVNGPAATYIEFMRHNTDSIVDALKQP